MSLPGRFQLSTVPANFNLTRLQFQKDHAKLVVAPMIYPTILLICLQAGEGIQEQYQAPPVVLRQGTHHIETPPTSQPMSCHV